MGVLYEEECTKMRCFYCGKRLFRKYNPAIYWHGYLQGTETIIYLHLNCVMSFVEMLARDIKDAHRVLEHRITELETSRCPGCNHLVSPAP